MIKYRPPQVQQHSLLLCFCCKCSDTRQLLLVLCGRGADPNSELDKNNSSVYVDGFRDYTAVMGVVISPLTHSVPQSSHTALNCGGGSGDGGGSINSQQETKVRKV